MRGLMQAWPMRVHRFLDHAALYHQGARVVGRTIEGGIHRTTYPEIRERALKLTGALARRGIKQGDRVATLAWNTSRHIEGWFGITGAGAVYHTLNPRLFPAQLAWITNHGGAKMLMFDICFAPLVEQIAPQLKHIETYVALSDTAPKLKLPGKLIAYEEMLRGKEGRWVEVDENDACGLCYTSGTTGEPKGVMLTHGNITSNQNFAAREFSFNNTDLCISFLPLSHVTARALDYVMYGHGAQVAYCSNFDKLPQSMKEVRPTVFVGVPRVYEKIRQAVEQKASRSPIKKRLIAWALRVGAQHGDTVYQGQKPSSFLWKLADKLVYSKVREAFGGRVRVWVSGGAPLGIDTAKWFAAAGIAVWEGYGLTETSPVIALNNPQVHRMGAVGKPLPNVELKFAEDGELLVRGPSIFVGYWQKPAANAECLDAEGWFRTGDIGHVDADGFLYITDRKKELLKTSGGKLVAPQPIENKLKNSVMVAQVALVGDKHKFVSALISPNFAALEDWAKHAGLETPNRQALVDDKRVVALYGEVVREANAGLANFETIKRFRLVPDEWSQDSGELTPSMKLKRRVISAKYASVIDELYADEATARAG